MAGDSRPKAREMSRATVRISVCVSLDGRVAESADAPPNQVKFGGWTSPEDKEIFADNVEWADFLVVGSKTLTQSPFLARKGKPIIVISRGSPPAISPGGSSLRYVVRPATSSLKNLVNTFQDKKLLLCGGVMTYGTFLRLDLVNEICMVVEPVILNSGPPFAFGGDIEGSVGKTGFELVGLSRVGSGQTFWAKYHRRR